MSARKREGGRWQSKGEARKNQRKEKSGRFLSITYTIKTRNSNFAQNEIGVSAMQNIASHPRNAHVNSLFTIVEFEPILRKTSSITPSSSSPPPSRNVSRLLHPPFSPLLRGVKSNCARVTCEKAGRRRIGGGGPSEGGSAKSLSLGLEKRET